jgi:hypothetical protein
VRCLIGAEVERVTNRASAAHLAASIAVVLLIVGWCAAAQADELGDALRAIEDLTLLRTLQLDDDQLPDLIAAVEDAVALVAGQQEREDAVLERMAETFRAARAALLLGQPIPPETAKMLEQAEADAVQRAAESQRELDQQIDAVRELLHPRQMALIDWRSAEERAQKGVKPPDPEAEAVFAMTLRAVDEARSLHPQRYWERLDIAAAYLTRLVPPGTPEFNRLYRRVLDVFERAIRTPAAEYARARVAFAEELLRLVGLMPQQEEADRPITREALTRVLTEAGTADLLREMVVARLQRARRG